MKKLIITLTIIFISNLSVYSQNSDSSSTGKRNIPYERAIAFSVLQGVNLAGMQYAQFDLGYFIFKNSELGVCVGKDKSPIKEDYGMIGGYFSQHYDEGFHIGLRIALPGNIIPTDINTYTEFYLGKDFSITNKFNLRTRISYSYLSKVFFGLNGDFKDKRISIQAGFNYLF